MLAIVASCVSAAPKVAPNVADVHAIRDICSYMQAVATLALRGHTKHRQ